MEKVVIDIAVWQEEDVFVSQCLNVDVSSYGETVEEAVDSLKEAVELHISGASGEDIGKVITNAIQPDLTIPLDSVRKIIPLDLNS